MIVEEKMLIFHGKGLKRVVGLRSTSILGSGDLSTRGCIDWKMVHISFVGY